MSEFSNREMFQFLNGIRDTGTINPLAATPYLQEEFGLSRHKAREVMKEWMKHGHKDVDDETQ